MPNSVNLQSFVWPSRNHPDRTPLYYQGAARLSEDGAALRIAAASQVSFRTAFNALSVNAWRRYTSASNFRLNLVCSGACTLTLELWKTPENGTSPSSPLSSHTYRVIGDPSQRREFPLTLTEDAAWASLTLEAEDDCTLLEASWHADLPHTPRPVRLAVVICSCGREAITRQKVADLTSLPADTKLKIVVVDNGGTLRAEDFGAGVTLIHNPNTGGAGGFTRGLMELLSPAGLAPPDEEAESRMTHVIFSDDDALLPACAIRRTLTLLSLVNAEYADARISGAMMIAETPTVQHSAMEWRARNGAVSPRVHSADLGIWENVLRHAVYFDAPANTDTYGAWWYCVMRVHAGIADDLPLPLFFQLDDMEYGVRFSRRGGKWMMLNGICCFHPDFRGKPPHPMREYYRFRNRYICQAMNGYNYPIGLPWRVVGNLFQLHSYTIVVQKKRALRDFITGPSVLTRRFDPSQFAPVPETGPRLVRYAIASVHVYLLRMSIRWRKAALTRRWQTDLPTLTSMAFWKRYLGMKP